MQHISPLGRHVAEQLWPTVQFGVGLGQVPSSVPSAQHLRPAELLHDLPQDCPATQSLSTQLGEQVVMLQV